LWCTICEPKSVFRGVNIRLMLCATRKSRGFCKAHSIRRIFTSRGLAMTQDLMMYYLASRLQEVKAEREGLRPKTRKPLVFRCFLNVRSFRIAENRIRIG